MGRGVVQRLQQRQVVVAQAPRTPSEQRLLAEWKARGGHPQFDDLLLNWFSSGNTLAADPAATDPGRWLEALWRIHMRDLGMAGYEAAEVERGFRDIDKPGSRKEREQLVQQLQKEATRATGGVMSEAHKRLLEHLHGSDPRTLAKYLSTYLSTAVLSRPHGFSSVGHVQADTALGRLLLHGLHVFLATFHDPAAQLRLHLRHHRSVAISNPGEELLQYCMAYEVGQSPSTFTGALPPAGAQVPLFDHLSLHWQLKVVADVMAGLVVPGDGCEPEDASSSLTLASLDTVYHWAAFNKLLLLGMYAPMEEAAAPEQQRQVAVGQLQQLATAREAEALSAVGAMQQSLMQFRCVLHDQLQSELAVGQAVLQLFAAQQQQRQPELLKQLQQQLQACHLPTLWAHASSGSSSSSSTGSDLQQGQQLVLLICSLLAWQVAVLQGDNASQLAPPQPQQQKKGQGSPSEQAGVQHKAQPMQQLLDAVMYGIGSGAAQHSSAARDVRERLSRSLGFGAAGQTGQQQQQQRGERQQQEQPQQRTDELLISWLLQLLLTRGPMQASTQGGGPSTEDCQAAGSSSGADAGGGPTGCIVDALHLQPFTRGVCHVLLVRLLSSAPPCEAWSWDACLSVLQLLVSMERAANAAGDAQYVKDAVLRYTLQEPSSPTTTSSSSSCSSSQAGPEECLFLNPGVKLALCMQELLSMMRLLHEADKALQDCQKRGNDSSGRESESSRSDSTARQQQQQQEVIQQVSEPSFWRSQALNLYKRKGGFAWLESFFEDATADNDKPGFWGLVGRLAAADQLNLCHADEPVAVAAAPSILSGIEPDNPASIDRSGQRVILGRQLARVANAQLLTLIAPLLQVGDHDGSPVQPLALHSLLTCALTAAQQPQSLAYASVPPSKMQAEAAVAAAAAAATAAAAAAVRRPNADGDGDTFYSPCASPEPSAAAAAAAACPADSAAAAAATAEAAADVWQEGWGFHLGSLLALGPLFDEGQQRPCLARFMQLLLQYHEDTSAAASAALQRLTPELQRQRLWVPEPGAGSSSSSKAGPGGSSSGAGFVPAERSRLLVLLMGLYHLQMLEEQEARHQEQQWKQAQRQREEECGRAHGVALGARQPQQQQTDGRRQQRQHLRTLRTPSGGAAAAVGSAGDSVPASTTDVYHDTGLRSVIIDGVVQAAYGMLELLLYCLAPIEELSTRSSSGSSGSSGNSRHAGAADGHRLQVCGISQALLQDGAMLLAQPVPGVVPAGAVCDRCSIHSTAESTTRQLTNPFGAIELLAARMAAPPAAAIACGDCGIAAYFCSDCASGAGMQQHRSSCAAAGGGLHQAWSDILCMLVKAGAVPGVKTCPAADSVLTEGCCTCRACQDVLQDRFNHLLLRWLACPMLQYSGPWGWPSTADQPGPQQQPQPQQNGPLPQALDGPMPLPPVLMRALECSEAGRFLQRLAPGLLENARAPLQHMFINLGMARGRAHLKEQEAGQRAKAAQQLSPKGSPAAKAQAPAGFKTPLERKHRQQQQQAGGGRRGMWSGGVPGVDPDLQQLFQEYGFQEYGLSELD